MAPKHAQAKKAVQKSKAAAKRPEEVESSPRRVSTRNVVKMQESPQVDGSTTASPSPNRPAVEASPARLRVDFQATSVGGSGQNSLEQGLVRLRSNNQLCDMNVITNSGKIAVHRAVLAAQSEMLTQKLQEGGDLDLHEASHEAVELVVKFCYGEVKEDGFAPSTSEVNEEILKISSNLALPSLSQLCAGRLAMDATTTNVVASVRLSEEYSLLSLRAALVKGILEDPAVLETVAKDPVTLNHPALMRELLAFIATKL